MSTGPYVCQTLRMPVLTARIQSPSYGLNLVYPSCPQCSRKVVTTSSQGTSSAAPPWWKCPNCGNTMPETQVRWVFKVKLSIAPLHKPVEWHTTAFSNAAEPWFGCTAAQWARGIESAASRANGETECAEAVERFAALLDIFGAGSWSIFDVKPGARNKVAAGSTQTMHGVITRQLSEQLCVAAAQPFRIPISLLWQLSEGTAQETESLLEHALGDNSPCEVYSIRKDSVDSIETQVDAACLLDAWQSAGISTWEIQAPLDIGGVSSEMLVDVTEDDIANALDHTSQLFLSEASTHMSNDQLSAFQYEESLQLEAIDDLFLDSQSSIDMTTPQRSLSAAGASAVTPTGRPRGSGTYTPPDTLMQWLETTPATIARNRLAPSHRRLSKSRRYNWLLPPPLPGTQQPVVLAPETPPALPAKAPSGSATKRRRQLFVGESPAGPKAARSATAGPATPSRSSKLLIAFESVPETPIGRALTSVSTYSKLRRRQYSMVRPMAVPETPAVRRGKQKEPSHKRIIMTPKPST